MELNEGRIGGEAAAADAPRATVEGVEVDEEWCSVAESRDTTKVPQKNQRLLPMMRQHIEQQNPSGRKGRAPSFPRNLEILAAPPPGSFCPGAAAPFPAQPQEHRCTRVSRARRRIAAAITSSFLRQPILAATSQGLETRFRSGKRVKTNQARRSFSQACASPPSPRLCSSLAAVLTTPHALHAQPLVNQLFTFSVSASHSSDPRPNHSPPVSAASIVQEQRRRRRCFSFQSPATADVEDDAKNYASSDLVKRKVRRGVTGVRNHQVADGEMIAAVVAAVSAVKSAGCLSGWWG
ncbi:hypothetical protein Drorol1_Dr00025904 [Drosera rotundifolia]